MQIADKEIVAQAPTMDEFVKLLSAYIAEYNRTPNRQPRPDRSGSLRILDEYVDKMMVGEPDVIRAKRRPERGLF